MLKVAGAVAGAGYLPDRARDHDEIEWIRPEWTKVNKQENKTRSHRHRHPQRHVLVEGVRDGPWKTLLACPFARTPGLD